MCAGLINLDDTTGCWKSFLETLHKMTGVTWPFGYIRQSSLTHQSTFIMFRQKNHESD